MEFVPKKQTVGLPKQTCAEYLAHGIGRNSERELALEGGSVLTLFGA